MSSAWIQHYIKLTEFLGATLGPDYEVALHDLDDKDNSIIAIANGHVSGRTIGAPLTSVALQAIADHSFENNDYRINYTGIAASKKMLRSSTFYIKDQTGRLVGLLCINFDDSRYQDISERLLKLRHPDAFVDTNFVYNEKKAALETSPPASGAENFHETLSDLTEEVITQALLQKSTTADRLTHEERMGIVETLRSKGFFLIKGAVKQAAEQLHCSPATIYRYLNKVGQEDDAKRRNGAVVRTV